MTRGALMLSEGHFSGAPMSTKPEKRLHLWNLSSEGVTRAGRLRNELSGTGISPPRGKGWSALDLCFSSRICQLAQIQKQWLDLRCSIDICRIESKLVSGISLLLWCEVHLVHQTKSEGKLSVWSRRDIRTVMEGPRTSANVRLAPCPWWAKLPCRRLLLSSPRSLSALSPRAASFLLVTDDRNTQTSWSSLWVSYPQLCLRFSISPEPMEPWWTVVWVQPWGLAKRTGPVYACETRLKRSGGFSYFSYQILRVSCLRFISLFMPRTASLLTPFQRMVPCTALSSEGPAA